jgi:hypothetical protein
MHMGSTGAVPQALPPEAVILQMVRGGRLTRALSDISRLNIPDVLKKRGPMSAAELVAGGIAANADALERVMRKCASVGVFTEDPEGKFGPTPLSDVLTADSPVSLKAAAQEAGEAWLKLFTELGDAIRTSTPQARQMIGMQWWDHLNANPEEREIFREVMKSNDRNSIRGVLEKCDFASIGTVVDVGGGSGQLVLALLEKYPDLRGVLLDVPDVTAAAQKNFPVADAHVASRLEYLGADMFESVPRAEAYILKHILHGWDDENCLRILRNCHASMEGDGRLICVDTVLPAEGETAAAPAKLSDLLMLLAIGGRERTRQQWEDLYRASGFRIASVTPLHDNFGTSIVEGVKP